MRKNKNITVCVSPEIYREARHLAPFSTASNCPANAGNSNEIAPAEKRLFRIRDLQLACAATPMKSHLSEKRLSKIRDFHLANAGNVNEIASSREAALKNQGFSSCECGERQ
jgi:hypothetical protein